VNEAVVRRVRAEDTDRRAVAALRRRWTEEDAGSAVDDAGYEDRAVQWMEANESHRLAWLALLDRRPVGFLTAVPLERMPQPGRPIGAWAYVHHFFVVPEHRDAGVGRQLLDAVVDEARHRGWERLLLHPRQRALRFYERAGFVTADRWLVLEVTAGGRGRSGDGQ
jgi:GNAT superfamily N-acetyltransferase